MKRWPEAAAALGGDEVDAPKGVVPQTLDRRDARSPEAICYGGDAARAARVASLWAARFARSRDWCASQARRYKSVAELKDKGDAAFRAGDARAAERWYAAALDEDPEHPALHYNAAACLEKLGRPLDAARCCASALRCRPDCAAARLRRARCSARPPPTATAGRTPGLPRGGAGRVRAVPDAAAERRRPEAPRLLQHRGPRGRRRGGARLLARARAQQAPPPPPAGGGPTRDVTGGPRDASRPALKRLPRPALRMHPDKSGARRRAPLWSCRRLDVLSDALERAADDRIRGARPLFFRWGVNQCFNPPRHVGR